MVSVVSLLRWNMWCRVVSVTAKVLWKHWNKFAPVNGISIAYIIYSHRQIYISKLSYNQLVTSCGCLYKIAHVKHKLLCYINITWRSLCNVLCSLWKVEGNTQQFPTAMVLIVGIVGTVILWYHFHTEYIIPPSPSAFSSIFLIPMQVYRVFQEEWTKLRESVPYVELYRYIPKHVYPKLNGYGDNGHRKVWASGVSTYCTPSVMPYSSTAHARQPDTAS